MKRAASWLAALVVVALVGGGLSLLCRPIIWFRFGPAATVGLLAIAALIGGFGTIGLVTRALNDWSTRHS